MVSSFSCKAARCLSEIHRQPTKCAPLRAISLYSSAVGRGTFMAMAASIFSRSAAVNASPLDHPVAKPVELFRNPVPYVATLGVNLDGAFSKPGQVGDMPLFGFPIDAHILDQDGGPMDVGLHPEGQIRVAAPPMLPTNIHGRSV